jgi:hypothetical protein
MHFILPEDYFVNAAAPIVQQKMPALKASFRSNNGWHVLEQNLLPWLSFGQGSIW